MAMAAGCAITFTVLPEAHDSTRGARTRAEGSSSQTYVRSIRTGERGSRRAAARIWRPDSVEPARKIARASSRLSASSRPTIAASPETSVSVPAFWSSPAISFSSADNLLSASRSRISRAINESLPTKASAGSLANLVLRTLRWRRSQVAAQQPTDANDDSAPNVNNRHAQQHGLGV